MTATPDPVVLAAGRRVRLAVGPLGALDMAAGGRTLLEGVQLPAGTVGRLYAELPAPAGGTWWLVAVPDPRGDYGVVYVPANPDMLELAP